MDEKKSFVFYRSFYEALQDLDNESRLSVYDAICALALNCEEKELNGFAKTIFKLIKPQIEANTLKYKNGQKGGRPRKEKEADKTEENRAKPKKANGFSENQKKQTGNEETKKTSGYEKEKTSGYDDVETNGYFLEKPNVNENDNDNVNDNDITALSDERSQPIASIILKDQSYYEISNEQVEEWEKAYPDIDVIQTLKIIEQWNKANPNKRKTKAGILRHVTGWLSKEQEKQKTKGVMNNGRNANDEEFLAAVFAENTL